jgi:hypothetical protein
MDDCDFGGAIARRKFMHSLGNSIRFRFVMCGFSSTVDDDAGLVVLFHPGNTGTGTDDDAGGEGLILIPS